MKKTPAPPPENPFSVPAEMMAEIRDSLMANGFTRRESVSFASAWLMKAITDHASHADDEAVDIQTLLSRIKIAGPKS